MADMFKLGIFLMVSFWLLLYSWRFLKDPRAHGFYRFFAFETILLLILHNLESWFVQPFSLQQVFSWLFLTASLILAIHGFYLLHELGHPAKGIEGTTQLVKQGAYRYIRHPLYFSLILFSVGAFLKQPDLVGFSLLSGILVFLYMTARVEEVENTQRFGQEYVVYMDGTKMFIPLIW